FTVIGLNFQWDLFTGLRRNARTQQARIDLSRAQMNKKRVEEQAEIDYQQAKGDLNVAIKSMQTNKRNRDLAKKILDNTRVKYREGISSSLDLSQAENQFLETERNYINALLQLVSARAKLERLTGKYNTY
ncbi:MAG: TolC family protein, partial [Cryomorphaceae bacterium]|nr:TolC family protein [Cryomorphaceae bacterium]